MYWTTLSQGGCNNSSRQCCSVRGCCLMSARFVFQVTSNFLSFGFLVLNRSSEQLYCHKVIIVVDTRAVWEKNFVPEGCFNKSTAWHIAIPWKSVCPRAKLGVCLGVCSTGCTSQQKLLEPVWPQCGAEPYPASPFALAFCMGRFGELNQVEIVPLVSFSDY